MERFVRRLFAMAALVLCCGATSLVGCSCTPQARQSQSSGREQSQTSAGETEDAESNGSQSDPAIKAKTNGSNATAQSEDTKGAEGDRTASGNASKEAGQSSDSDGGGGRSKKGGKAKRGTNSSATALGAESSSGAGGGRGELNAPESAQRAEALQATAEKLEREGKLGNAFLSASEAWELVRQHPEDGDCARLEQELISVLERLGERVGAGSVAPPDSDRLLIK